MRLGCLDHLPPSAFAVVMATGIVGVGASLHGYALPATALGVLAAAEYVVLVGATVRRLLRHPRGLLAELHDPGRAFGFFTFVAGTGVLAVAVVGAGGTTLGAVLLAIGAAAWLVLGYAVPWLAVFAPGAPRPVLLAANGSWFVWVVASQSVAVVAASLQPQLPRLTSALAIVAVFAWSVGLVLYVVAAVLVCLRFLLYDVTAETIDPAYWVAMGALAITVVAGSRIVQMHDTAIVAATRGLVAGLAVVLWSFASWLIPALVALGIWRHVGQRVPLRYEAAMWSMVFPLGMYSVAGMYLGRADALPFVEVIGRAWFWVGAASWVLVTGGAVRAALRSRTGPAGARR